MDVRFGAHNGLKSGMAVFRLISNSNMMDFSTGVSAGIAPRKIRATYSAPFEDCVGDSLPKARAKTAPIAMDINERARGEFCSRPETSMQ